MNKHQESDGNKLYHLLSSEDWGVAMRILDEKLNVLRDVTSVDGRTAEELGQQTLGRQMLVSFIEEWRSDLETRRDNFLAVAEKKASDDDKERAEEPIVVNRE